jgi:hypothetical protein
MPPRTGLENSFTHGLAPMDKRRRPPCGLAGDRGGYPRAYAGLSSPRAIMLP